ncbi:MAG: acetate--CoA ligase family protein [candidate division WOR-3 bacterium]|nr:acetate--CoA ligase family protein [candidate division WOR-3 bacterium]MCX7947096.1 acetate--CoA ligase family protein [candidate division WOR-3 bacterium]MDW8149863.1 acetate--CoA ligase family protein [candidate division WOR-3 bacterium]
MLKILEPKSIAVIGASRDENSVGFGILRNIIFGGYKGVVYPVNPRAKSILGIKSYSSVLDIEDEVDIGIVVTPYYIVEDILTECGKKGIPYCIIISSGFKEVGEEGLEREIRILEIARRYNIRILGPNCFGIMNTDSKISLNATFSKQIFKDGNIAFISQSGALAAGVLDYAKDKNIGFSKVITLGNKADLDEVDFLLYLKDDPLTKVILLYLEDISRGREFLEVAREITENYKPILAIKSGRTEEGKRAVSSHTGSLTSSDELYEAVFKQSGVLRVESVEELFNYATAFSNLNIPKSNRIVILTNAGGPGILAVDSAIRNKLSIPETSEKTKEELRKILPNYASLKNPIDTTGGISVDEYIKVLNILDKDDSFDGIIAIFVRAFTMDINEFCDKVLSIYKDIKKPIIITLMGITEIEQGLRKLQENSIVVYTFPEDAVRSFKELYEYKTWLERPRTKIRKFDVNKEKARNLIINAKRGKEGFIMEDKAFEALRIYGFNVVNFGVANSINQANSIAREIGFPVVLKVLSSEIVHKFDIGGIKLNIRNEKELEIAFSEMLEKFNDKIDGIIVQKMISKGYEVIVGAKRDKKFGPIVLFGLGGIYVEVFKDISFRLAPIREYSAHRMIQETKAYELLKGVRGQKPANIDSLVETIERLSQMIVEIEEIDEIDINPVIVNEEGAFIVDTRIRIR